MSARSVAACGLDAGELQALRRADGRVSVEKTLAETPEANDPRPEASAAAEAVALEGVRIRCPHCSSPVGIGDEDHIVACAYCGSWLVADRPRDHEVLRIPPRAFETEQLERARIHERLTESLRALERAGEVRGRGETIDSCLAKEQAWLEDRVSVSPRRMVYLPYWHYHGLDWIGAFGNNQSQLDPETRLAGRRWQRSDPAYDGEAWNLRDALVRLGIDGSELLTAEDLASGVETVRVAATPRAATEDGIRPPDVGVRFEGLEETGRCDQPVWVSRHLIFKPFLLARIVEPIKRRARSWEAPGQQEALRGRLHARAR